MKVQTQLILHKMTAHTFCSDTESNLILFTYYFVKKASKATTQYLHKTPVMACSNTFLDSSSIHGGTAVLFTVGGFSVLKLRNSKKDCSNILKRLITIT